ncbi:MAG: hypothetical protein IMW99_06965 [Firmicutes bacterium]|nr:hypothetical protein [Bacillota bacterium]
MSLVPLIIYLLRGGRPTAATGAAEPVPGTTPGFPAPAALSATGSAGGPAAVPFPFRAPVRPGTGAPGSARSPLTAGQRNAWQQRLLEDLDRLLGKVSFMVARQHVVESLVAQSEHFRRLWEEQRDELAALRRQLEDASAARARLERENAALRVRLAQAEGIPELPQPPTATPLADAPLGGGQPAAQNVEPKRTPTPGPISSTGAHAEG